MIILPEVDLHSFCDLAQQKFNLNIFQAFISESTSIDFTLQQQNQGITIACRKADGNRDAIQRLEMQL